MKGRLPLEPRGLSRTQAAAYVGIGTSLFDELVRDGRMPQPFKIRSRVLWDRYKIDEAFESLADRKSTWDGVA